MRSGACLWVCIGEVRTGRDQEPARAEAQILPIGRFVALQCLASHPAGNTTPASEVEPARSLPLPSRTLPPASERVVAKLLTMHLCFPSSLPSAPSSSHHFSKTKVPTVPWTQDYFSQLPTFPVVSFLSCLLVRILFIFQTSSRVTLSRKENPSSPRTTFAWSSCHLKFLLSRKLLPVTHWIHICIYTYMCINI